MDTSQIAGMVLFLLLSVGCLAVWFALLRNYCILRRQVHCLPTFTVKRIRLSCLKFDTIYRDAHSQDGICSERMPRQLAWSQHCCDMKWVGLANTRLQAIDC